MTTNEYAPTTDDVRNDYRFSNKRPDVCGKDFGDEFDRWLDATIRQAKAEALREAAGEIEAQGPEMGRDINISPYREGLSDGVQRAVRVTLARASRIEAGE